MKKNVDKDAHYVQRYLYATVANLNWYFFKKVVMRIVRKDTLSKLITLYPFVSLVALYVNPVTLA
jgi:hypothetical protein